MLRLEYKMKYKKWHKTHSIVIRGSDKRSPAQSDACVKRTFPPGEASRILSTTTEELGVVISWTTGVKINAW